MLSKVLRVAVDSVAAAALGGAICFALSAVLQLPLPVAIAGGALVFVCTVFGPRPAPRRPRLLPPRSQSRRSNFDEDDELLLDRPVERDGAQVVRLFEPIPTPGELHRTIERHLRGSDASRVRRDQRIAGRPRRAAPRHPLIVGDGQRFDFERQRPIGLGPWFVDHGDIGDDMAGECRIRHRRGRGPGGGRFRPLAGQGCAARNDAVRRQNVSDCQSVERNSVSKILSRSTQVRASSARSSPAAAGDMLILIITLAPGNGGLGQPFEAAALFRCEGRRRSGDRPTPHDRNASAQRTAHEETSRLLEAKTLSFLNFEQLGCPSIPNAIPTCLGAFL